MPSSCPPARNRGSMRDGHDGGCHGCRSGRCGGRRGRPRPHLLDGVHRLGGAARPQGLRRHARRGASARLYAYNQGFYNLFLAVEALLGVALVVLGAGSAFRAGTALVLYGTGSMVAAALVLGLCSPAHRGAALKQGALPALAIICLCAGLLPA